MGSRARGSRDAGQGIAGQGIAGQGIAGQGDAGQGIAGQETKKPREVFSRGQVSVSRARIATSYRIHLPRADSIPPMTALLPILRIGYQSSAMEGYTFP